MNINTYNLDETEKKMVAAFFGAAIGDAMGGPVECQHAARIKKLYGRVDTLLPYRKPPGLLDLKPGYALHDAAGSITDDTFIRLDFCHYMINSTYPYTRDSLVDWLLKNAVLKHWWPPALLALENIASGKTTAENNGRTHPQGGGNGWWTPVGMICAGKPRKAFKICMELSTIWKSPLEQELNASIQAGLAYAFTEGATAGGLVDTMLDGCGPLASKLIIRAADTGRRADSFEGLIRDVYENLLVDEELRDPDGPLPEKVIPLDYSDEEYTSVMLAEQVALEVAALLFTDGSMKALSHCVMLGRDCDSTSTTVGSWLGALHGFDTMPSDWIDTVQEANMVECDLLKEALGIVDLRRKLLPRLN